MIAPPPTNLQALAERLKVLAEPKRLLILHFLMEGVQCNCELGDALTMPPNLISHHLRALREAGLVNAAIGTLFDASRIKPRRPNCGPRSAWVQLADIGFPAG